MLYTEDLKTKLFKDKNDKKYTPASLYYGSKKTGGYSILEPSQKEIEIFNGYNDSAFIKINGESSQSGTPSPESPVNINSPSNFDLITTNGSGQTKTINLPYTLNSLPDGTADYIEIDNINKTAKLYKLVGEYTFIGNERLAQTGSTPAGFRVVAMLKNDAIILSPCQCSHFKQIGTETDTINELLNFNNSATYKLRLKILSSRLATDNVAGVKDWLAAQYNAGTPVKVTYKLATPTVTNLDYDEVTTYYPYTKIYTNATVQPTLDGKIRVQGENKSALDLTTTDAQISMGNDNALRLRNNFTVACFIKSTIIPTSNQYFLRRYDISINGRCWGMIRTSTRPSPQNKGLTVLVSNNGITSYYVYGTGNIDTTDGNWHHMAFTYSDKTVKMYVDGLLDKEELVTALTSNDLTDTASVFGSAPSYSGLLDDIRYYSRVLTDDEILKLSKGLKVSDTNMVGHWKCNEGKGTTVKNETNIANTDGTLNAQAKWTNDTIYQ